MGSRTLMSPERFVIGSPVGLQPNQMGGTLPSATPPAGVFNQQSAEFGKSPANTTSKPESWYLAPELSGAPSFQGSPATSNSPNCTFQAGGVFEPQQVPTGNQAQHHQASQPNYSYFNGNVESVGTPTPRCAQCGPMPMYPFAALNGS